jgi:dTDP-4-amino-4,6-dideoxygalactose transaminase
MFNAGVIEKLEKEIREYFSTRFVFLVSSGKAALFLILSGLKLSSKRKKVIIPAYTCYSVPSAIVKAGLDIVLCDVDPDRLDFDFKQLERLIDDDTLCIISTHLFGIPSEIGRIREFVGRKEIFIIEDAAQAMGVVANGKKLGTFGDVAFFSLGRGKNITCGSGGIIITSSEEISENIRKIYQELKREPIKEYVKEIFGIFMMVTFIHPNFYWFPKGLPFLKIGETKYFTDFPIYPLSSFKAGILYHWREQLEIYNEYRIRTAHEYITTNIFGMCPFFEISYLWRRSRN